MRREKRHFLAFFPVFAAVFLSATIHTAVANDAEILTPSLGIFNDFFATALNGGQNASTAGFFMTGGDFSGFLDAARALAHGDDVYITSSLIDAVLGGVVESEDPNFDLSPRGSGDDGDVTSADMYVENADSDFERARRRAFAKMFDFALGVTSESMRAVIDVNSTSGARVEETLLEATREARNFASQILNAGGDSGKREAAIALYDRVESGFVRARNVLRRAAMAESSAELAASANELIGDDDATYFNDGNSRWIITSSTGPVRYVQEDPARDRARGHSHRDVALGVGASLSSLALVVLVNVRRRPISKANESLEDATTSNITLEPSKPTVEDAFARIL